MAKLIDKVDSLKEEMVAFQKLITAIPALSPEAGGEGEKDKCEAIESWLKKEGFTDITHFDAEDPRVKSGIRPNLVVTVPGESERRLWIIAHMDVVSPGDAKKWQTNPWQAVEKNGYLYGRGVEDDQQGMTSSLFAALVFLREKVKPAFTVKILLAADEEMGSKYGMSYLLENTDIFRKDDLFLVPDAGDEKGETIEIAEKGVLWLKITVKGKQIHASTPDEGVNASLAACALSLRLHELEKTFSKKDPLFSVERTTIEPTKRESNVESVNIIPGEDTFYVDIRIIPSYTTQEIMDGAKWEILKIEKEYGVEVEMVAVNLSEASSTEEGAEIVCRLKKALEITHGIKARAVGIGGGTVAAMLRHKGYEACVWSTLDMRAHSVDEYCRISNMIDDAKTMITLMEKE